MSVSKDELRRSCLPYPPIRKTGDQCADAARIMCGGGLRCGLWRDPVDAFENFVRRWIFAPISEKVHHIEKRHLVDLGRRIEASTHQAGVDQREIKSTPACASPGDVSAVSDAMKPASRNTARMAVAISPVVASTSCSFSALCA